MKLNSIYTVKGREKITDLVELNGIAELAQNRVLEEISNPHWGPEILPYFLNSRTHGVSTHVVCISYGLVRYFVKRLRMR